MSCCRPTDQPVAALLPALLELTGPADADTDVGFDLLTVEGESVDQRCDLAASGLRDGVLLRLVSARESPPSPVVYDLVDVVEAAEPAGLWTRRNRQWVMAALSMLLVAAATGLWAVQLPEKAVTVVVAVGAVAVVGSLVATAVGARALAWSALLLGWSALVTGLLLADLGPIERAVLTVALAVVVILSAGWTVRRMRRTTSALLTLLLLTGTSVLSFWLTDDLVRSAAVVATVAAAVIGLLPRWALASTGAFGIDTRVTTGHTLARVPVERAVADAHWGLAGGVVLCAIFLATSTYVVAVRGGIDVWLTTLTVALLLGWSLRSRHFPLAVERLLMLVAAGCGLIGLARALLTAPPDSLAIVLGVVFAAAVLTVVAMTLPSSELLGAVGRRWAGRLEAFCILVVIPLLVGAFGVYGDLLDTF